jgi:Ni/Fe-hydrogenase subunit HybB-like protein
MRVRTVKTILWFLFGAGLTVTALRIINGPGSVVALTDLVPWGLWKGGGVVALVPIGGAGFTLAALVYVFHCKRYEPLALGAVLLGLMCYSSVATGLTFDIGIWWRIVFPVAFWQPHSTLFEIAWCIMLYLGVLVAEFSHVVAAKRGMTRLTDLLHRFGIVFVIAGISLSALHQSSLGTLFLATPYRLHPLWHTDLLPVLFLITSVGLGCLTISWVALVTHRLYDAERPMDAISGLARISSIVLWFYLILRLTEIVVAAEASLLVQANWDTFNFWIEILLSAAIPCVLLLKKRYRESPTAVFWISSITILGVSLNRVNVAGLATVTSTHHFYLPAWTEWTVTIGVLAGAAIVFLFCVEHFRVFKGVDPSHVRAAHEPGEPDRALWKTVFFHSPGSEMRTYSAAFVIAAGVVFGLVPDQSVFGVRPVQTPVAGPRHIEIEQIADDEVGARVQIVSAGLQVDSGSSPPPLGSSSRRVVMMVDGNRNGDYVLFDHDQHASREGGASSCTRCHHMRLPYEKVSRCTDCHSDMYLPVDTFKHDVHVTRMGGNSGCSQCHSDPARPKIRETTKPCGECHSLERHPDSVIRTPEGNPGTVAVGYKDAMHGLCVSCHGDVQPTLSEPNPDFARCSHCHGNLPQLDGERWKSQL